MKVVDWRIFNAQNVLLLCTVVLLSVMIIMPLGFLLFAAFWSEPAGAPEGQFTLNNFIKVFGDYDSWRVILNSLMLGALVTLITVPCGFGFAWIVQRTNTPRRNIINLFMTVPLFISPLLLCLAYIAIMNPTNGFFNLVLRSILGLHGEGPLNVYTFSSIVFLLVLHFVPYAYLNILDPLGNLDGSLEEAAKISGAGGFRRFRDVTLPVVLPAVGSAALIVFVLATEQFTTVTLLGPAARFPTMPASIYTAVALDPSDPNYAAAMGVILLAITGVGVYFYRKMARKAFMYVTVTGKFRQLQISDIGKWKYATFGVCVIYMSLAIVLPYMAIVAASLMDYVTPDITWESFTLINFTNLFTRADNFKAMTNTLFLSILGASITVILALLMAFIVVRMRISGKGIIEYMCMVPVAVPGLSLALGMLWAYLYLPIPIYGTIWVILVAYITKFLAQGYRITSSGLLQVAPELDEAARISGASSLRALRQITAPILWPSLLSSWILIFILAALEVSVTVILFTSESLTMSIAIWDQLSMGESVIAYALAVILGGMGFIVLILAHKMFGTMRHV